MKRAGKKIITTRYKVGQKGGCAADRPLRIALVSDLHDMPYEEALEILQEERPDLIAAAGDLMERCDPDNGIITMEEMERWQSVSKRHRALYKILKQVANTGLLFTGFDQKPGRGISFLKEAAKIAPVFYSVGNHEWYFLSEDRRMLKQAGIVLLDNEDTVYERDGTRIRIGGLSTRYDLEWLHTFGEKAGSKLLLCHHPEYYKRFIRGKQNGSFSLILSGHVHGGQWRFGKRGLLAPGQGLFPEYCYGMYDGKLIVSSGLSNTAGVPRFGNPREVVLIEWLPEGADET